MKLSVCFCIVFYLSFVFLGDQGLMFGYATDETEESMPLTVVLAHKLNKKLSDLRRDGTLWWACPDTKSQVISLNVSLFSTIIKINIPPRLPVSTTSIMELAFRCASTLWSYLRNIWKKLHSKKCDEM